MKLLKPSTVNHNGDNGEENPIFCIDVHPNGTSFATGGGDSCIKIWEMSSIIASKKDAQILLFKRTLEGTVNCVRFSHSGKYLVSASDEIAGGCLKVWEKTSENFGYETSNKENWRDVRTFRKHKKDIAGVCWSPDDSMIASCSLDNTVVIWSIQEKKAIMTIEENKGFIKGIAWDPIGKYIATHSSQAVRLWRIENWTEEHEITSPFSKLDESMFYKLDWSPEGSHLVAANAVNQTRKTAVILSRGQWNGAPQRDFVGHSRSTTSVRFSPKLFTTGENTPTISYCAIGSLDGVVSVWATSSSKALVVLTLFESCVQDISWSSDGSKLLACSTKGEIAIIRFDKKELGTPLSNSEMQGKLKEIYGATMGSTSIVENVPQMKFELAKEEKMAQIEKAKKEIIEIEDDEEDDEEEGTPMEIEESKPIEQPTPLPPIEVPEPSEPSKQSKPSKSATPQKSKSSSSIKKANTHATIIKQDEEILPSGKRRITPFFLGAPGSSMDISQEKELMPPMETKITEPSSETKLTGKKRSRQVLKKSVSPTRQPQSVTTTKSGKKRITPQKVSSPQSSNTPTPSTSTTHAPAAKKRRINPINPKSPVKSQAVSHTFGQQSLSLQLPADVDTLTLNLPPRSELDNTPLVVTTSVVRTHGQERGILKCSKSGRLEWKQLVEGRPSLLTGTEYYCALSCKNGYLHIFSSAGRRIFPAISLGSPISFLQSNDRAHLLAITASGKLYVWDISTKKVILLESVKGTLLHANTTIQQVKLSPQGNPIIITSTNECFTFNQSMKTWISVANNTFSRSCYQSVLPSKLTTDSSSDTLASLQTTAQEVSEIPLPSFSAQLQETESLSHINNQVVCALALQSRGEYKHWLMIFARRLTEDGNETVLQEICEELHSQPQGAEILELSCFSLLNEIVEIISSNRKLQRLVERYSAPQKHITLL